MKVESYRGLIVWQRAIEMTVAIYGLTAQFPREEAYGLTAQLRRAGVFRCQQHRRRQRQNLERRV